MPYYCTVPRCTSMAGKAKNVSFHQFPRDEELAKLWNNILKRGKPYTKYSKVCSLHFKPEDYTITSVGKNKGQWRTLRKDAIPSQNLPSDTPAPYSRRERSTGSWVPSSPPPGYIDPRMQQQMAQAIYVQTMLAMHAAGATEPLSVNAVNGTSPLVHKDVDSPHSISNEQLHTPDTTGHNDTQPNAERTSYKCTECLKCFKDPDVFILHRRTHSREDSSEKENSDEQQTLKANPILANLLRANTENINRFDTNNILSIENHIMAALAVNMETYIRNISSMLNKNNNQSSDERNSDDDRILDESTDSNKLVIDENV
ncbi:uncharacterized protein LOC128681812 [Plodia interpunctella]|uniref:uncharacterized protein LOC128681812 n=1 Tax=Plodia interpunctella TaxID=58824 RepID=UPI0023676565|nr:uncharacterized protein LOC128681812 [Plodia interpunctella]